MKKISALIWLLFLGGSVFLFPRAQAEQAASPPPAETIAVLEFREVDIKDILRQLAKQYNLNIVFSESVKGLVTVQLNNVSIEQALDSVITVNGFAYTKKENVYKVTTQEEAQKEGKQTKLFKLSNAEATKLKDTLAKVLTPEGTIEADSRSNSMIVTDSISTINKIEKMLPALDEMAPQVLIEAKIIETSLTNSEKLGIDWQTTITATGAKRPTTFPFTSWDTNRYYPVPKYEASVDSATGQVTVTSDFPIKGDAFLTPGATPQIGSFPMVDASAFTFGTLDFSAFQAVLDIVRTRGNTKLIAAPRIATVNNQKATINVGKVVPIATYERSDQSGLWQVTGWTEQNIGINLEVLPQISPDGHIKLKLRPEVSNIIDYIGTGPDRRPITSTRTAETEVIVQDGYTVVIGGLVVEKESQTVKKIPFLGDLPLIGGIFTRKEVGTDEEPKEKSDLLIFVTTRIMKEGRPADEVKAEGSVRPFKMETRGVHAQ